MLSDISGDQEHERVSRGAQESRMAVQVPKLSRVQQIFGQRAGHADCRKTVAVADSRLPSAVRITAAHRDPSARSQRTIALCRVVLAHHARPPSPPSASSTSPGAPWSSKVVRSDRSAIPTVLRHAAVWLAADPKCAAMHAPCRNTTAAPCRRRTRASGLAGSAS
jgi:hypothetical protein